MKISKIITFLSLASFVASVVTTVAYRYFLDLESYCRPSDVVPFAIDCGDEVSGFLANLFNPGLFVFKVLWILRGQFPVSNFFEFSIDTLMFVFVVYGAYLLFQQILTLMFEKNAEQKTLKRTE